MLSENLRSQGSEAYGDLDDAMLNATLRALCVPPENGVREQTKRKASVEHAMQPFSVARWALWKGGEGQLPHGVWVPFGAARSHEHRHTRARKFRHDRSETHPQEQRGEGFTQRESWGGRLDVDKTSTPPKFFRRCGPRCSHTEALRARGSAAGLGISAALLRRNQGTPEIRRRFAGMPESPEYAGF